MIFTDRSRNVLYHNCKMARYLNYHIFGTGVVAKELSLPLLDGLLIHKGIDLTASGEDIEDVVEILKREFEETVKEQGVRNEKEAPGWFIREQQALLEGLIRLWVMHRWPMIQEEYDYVTGETDMPWELEEGEIVQGMRADMVLRRRADGLLFLMEFKTLSMGSDEWTKQWNENAQITSYTLAAQEKFNEPIGGVMIEGLVKGSRKIEKAENAEYNGYRIQQSPLCYVYEDPSDGEISLKWKKNWNKRPTWECIGVKGLVDVMSEEEVRKVLLPVPPIRPNETQLKRWRVQTIAVERKVAEDVKIVANDPEALDKLFPMNYDHCRRFWGHPCQFMNICFDEGVRGNVLGCGLYERRKPHHVMEVVEEIEEKREEEEVEI